MSSMTAEIRVAIVEDLQRTRTLLATFIDAAADCRITGSFTSMEEALPALDGQPADVVLADIGLPGMSGIEGVRRLKTASPGTQVLMLTVYDDNAHIFEAICAGASGYLLKDTPPDRVLGAIRELRAGGAPMTPEIARKVVAMFQRVAPPRNDSERLSPREVEVLKLLADGHSYKTAADTLKVSIDAVRFHIRHIYDKLHVHSKSEAVLKAFKSGLVG
jgi:DNA-binding NarL/FixJ family response regulator